MANNTVKQFAESVKAPVERLLTQLQEAGLDIKDPEHVLSEEEKMKLLGYLRQSHGKKPAATPTRKITVKRRTTGEAKAAGTAGKARTVAVEVRKKRTFTPGADAAAGEKTEEQKRLEAEAEAARKALEARRAELEADNKAMDDAAKQRRAEREAAEAEAKLKAAEEAKRKAEQEAIEKNAEKVRKAAAEKEALKAAAAAPPAPESDKAAARPTRKAPPAKKQAPRGKDSRGGGDGQLHLAAGKGRRKKKAAQRNVKVEIDNQHTFEKPTAPVIRDVEVPETITVAELAQRMAVKGADVVKTLMGMGAMVTINQSIDQDTAMLVVEEMGHNAKAAVEESVEDTLLQAKETEESTEGQEGRPPVVTVMGHVDHGKTSLLDYIRKSRVTAGEAGGITQHIGAYHVETEGGVVSFLDTPGHAAFTSMRARGANATDVVILVVAADDGAMPQTVEAVQHAKAAGVPMVVAVNKIDKEEADPDRVRNDLSAHEVISEDWGGDVPFVNVSAHTGQGIDELLEAVLLQSEILELTANPTKPASGVVIESSVAKGRGPVATVLVQDGTLRKGDMILCGQEFGRVRAMYDENGQEVTEAGPSIPVSVLGLSGVPQAGDEALVVADERKAREVAEFRQQRERDAKLKRQQAAKMEALFEQMKEGGERATLNILLKTDVQGSCEALRESFVKLSNEEVKVNVVTAGVGGINSSDVDLAMASEAILIGFNVRADAAARKLLQEHEMDVHYFSIIYEAIDVIKNSISGMMTPDIKEEILGTAIVKEVFRGSGFGQIAGSLVEDGVLRRSCPIRVLRDSVVIHEGELDSLRRFKDDVNEVQSGVECGIGVKNYKDVRPGDQIECFTRTEVAKQI
jgi:translation initiation factor IF-2